MDSQLQRENRPLIRLRHLLTPARNRGRRRTLDEGSREWFKQTVRHARYARALSNGSSPAIATWFLPFFLAK